MKYFRLFTAALFILMGVFWTLASVFNVSFNLSLFWPWFLILPGVALWLEYLFESNKTNSYLVLIPANILLFLGLFLFTNSLVSLVFKFPQIWELTIASYTVLPLAIAFAITWVASKKDVFLIPTIIFSSISACMFVTLTPLAILTSKDYKNLQSFVAPGFLIVIGLLIVISSLTSWYFKRRFRDVFNNTSKWEQKFDQWGRNIEKWGKKIEKNWDGSYNNTDSKAATDEAEILPTKI